MENSTGITWTDNEGKVLAVRDEEFYLVIDCMWVEDTTFVPIAMELRRMSKLHVGQATTLLKTVLHWLRNNGTPAEKIKATDLLRPYGLTERGYS